MARRRCRDVNQAGQPCQQAPLRDGDRCFWHDPAHAAEAADARRLGGLRRRREHTLEGAYEVRNLRTVAGLQRVLEVAILDTLGLDNSIARARTLGYLVGVGLKAWEIGELDERVADLEMAVRARPRRVASPLDEPEAAIVFVEPAS